MHISYITQVNARRAERWHPGFPDEEGPQAWSGADWSNAMAGEAGEVCNVVKKLRRIDCGLRGAVDGSAVELVGDLADEIADTFLYLTLLATYYGIDMEAAIVRKFNAISVREGFPDRMHDPDCEWSDESHRWDCVKACALWLED